MRLKAKDDLILLLEEASLFAEKVNMPDRIRYALCDLYGVCEYDTSLYVSHYQAQCIVDSLLEFAYAMGCYGIPRYCDLALLYMCQFYDLYLAFLEQSGARVRDSHWNARDFIVRHRITGCVLEFTVDQD